MKIVHTSRQQRVHNRVCAQLASTHAEITRHGIRLAQEGLV